MLAIGLQNNFKTYLELLRDRIKGEFYDDYNEPIEILEDISHSGDEEAFNRLFLWMYPALIYISNYPMYKERKVRFDYDCLQDKNEVQGEIVFGFLKVLNELNNDCTALYGKSKTDMYNLIAIKVRYISQHNIYKALTIKRQREKGERDRYIKRLIFVPEVFTAARIEEGGNILEKLIEEEENRFISRKIYEFLEGKDKEDIIIFYTSILKNTGEWEGRRISLDLTEREIANLIKANRRNVVYRKKKLRNEFVNYWNTDIKPNL